MMNKRAFTLVEMMVAMVVAAILMIVVGKISDIATKSSTSLRQKAEMFSEIMYAYKYMQKYVREADLCTPVGQSGSWIGSRLECSSSLTGADSAFGIWNNAGTRQFVYVPDKNNTNVRDVLFEVKITGGLPTNAFTFTPTLNSGMVNVRIAGNKDKIPFDITSSIKKRG